MKRGVRAQVSVEYMIVLGMALLLLLPGSYLFYSFSQGTNDQLIGAQITRAGLEILSTADAMYAVGQNSWSTITINFPENVKNIYILDNEELVVEYETQNGLSEAIFFSNINITGAYSGNISYNFQYGLTKIKVSSMGSYVVIEELLE